MERNPHIELGKRKVNQEVKKQILTCSLGFATCGCLNDTNSAQKVPSLVSMASCTYQTHYRIKVTLQNKIQQQAHNIFTQVQKPPPSYHCSYILILNQVFKGLKLNK